MKPQDNKNIQDDYHLYRRGLDYKTEIGLFETVDKNNRFTSGDQWAGVVSNGLPTPVFNVIKRVLGYKVSSIMQNALTIQYSVENGTPEQMQAVELVNHLADNTWEKLKMETSNENMLKDAFIQGDGFTYYYWKPDVDTGFTYGMEPVLGALCKEEIDNVCVFPGDCNNPVINTADGPVQPYMLVVFRQMVSRIREEAKKNGVPKDEIERITADEENYYTAGDRGKTELNDGGDREDGKANVILKFWHNPETKTIWARKSCKHARVKKEWDTGLHLYPIAGMCWETVKNSFHGQAEVTGLIPNQIYINKCAAMIMLASMYVSYPKLVYDRNKVSQPSNRIGVAIGVNGNIQGTIQYLNPGQISADVFKWFETVIQQTKDMMGANETALGDTSVTETASGIVALQQAAAIPLESIKRRFYQYIEDIALIWADVWRAYFDIPRPVRWEDKGQEMAGMLDMSILGDAKMTVKVDVGPSTRWSQITSIQTLDNLLQRQIITPLQYFERVPAEYIPDKDGIIDDIKAQQQMQNDMAMAPKITPEAIMAQLTPEERAAVEADPSILDNALGGGNMPA